MEVVQQLGVDRYNVRKPDRHRVVLETQIRMPLRPDISVSVRNLSSRGFMAELRGGLPIGTDTMLFLPGIGWALATVRWSMGNRFGARFSDSINMRQFWRANPPRRLSYLHEVRLSA